MKRRFFVGVSITCVLIGVLFCFLAGFKTTLHLPSNYSGGGGGYIHFSVDDTIALLKDITIKESYNSIFENPTLHYFKRLHDKYGVKVSFYVFYEEGNTADCFNLSDVTSKFSGEFSENSDWLRFGFHAKNWTTHEIMTSDIEDQAYRDVERELIRITGSDESIDRFIRLDYYEADRDCVDVLRKNGVIGLLTADDPERMSYDLSYQELETCNAQDCLYTRGMIYTPTDVRLEHITSDEVFYNVLEQIHLQERIIVFTHERFLLDVSVQKYLEWFSTYAVVTDTEFAFPEDVELYARNEGYDEES